ncbi:hypothetical protein [uncultured Parabacteroides sp.]|uniref:hypothetical protein n=1 Tax=uncultured Parabacteroides sp. TaxID=512312 RepID=UPI0025930298|nr:hypothetical protein [uncultured Parabacteroides sp.]
MVRFEKNKFIIEVPTGGNPVEDWLNTMRGVMNVLGNENPEIQNEGYYHALWLLQNMLPEWEEAKKMA